MIHFACPKCAKTLSAKDSLAGAAVACRSCGEKFHVPGLPRGSSVKVTTGDAGPRSQAGPPKTSPQAKGPSAAPPDRKAAPRRPADEPQEAEFDAVYDESEEPQKPLAPRKRPPKDEPPRDEAADDEREREPAEDEEERPRKKKKKK